MKYDIICKVFSLTGKTRYYLPGHTVYREMPSTMFEKNLHTTVLFDIYGDMLTSQQQAVIDMYYNQDLSLAEISEQIGITRQGVQYTLKHGEDAL